LQKCDSCGETVTILLPLRIYEEGKYGDEMLNKWYCICCWAIIIDAYKDEKEDGKEDGNKNEPDTNTQIFFDGYTHDSSHSFNIEDCEIVSVNFNTSHVKENIHSIIYG